MDKAALQARVLAKLGKEVPPSRAPKAKAPARAPQPLPDSGSDDGSASSSSSEDWRIEVAPVARARKGYADDAISDGSADSAESESKERHPPLIARGLCSRRQLGRCIRQRRRSLQIALAAIVVTVLGFVVTTLLRFACACLVIRILGVSTHPEALRSKLSLCAIVEGTLPNFQSLAF
ncbi:unnamed protein product [Effrenium voratum]|nr:unnamed protein product [Effrenium voratum]